MINILFSGNSKVVDGVITCMLSINEAILRKLFAFTFILWI